MVAYVAEPGVALLLMPVIGAVINRWWTIPLGLTWITLPLVDTDEVGGPDAAGDWNPYPVVALIVVPAACAAFASGVVARRLVAWGWRRLRA